MTDSALAAPKGLKGCTTLLCPYFTSLGSIFVGTHYFGDWLDSTYGDVRLVSGYIGKGS